MIEDRITVLNQSMDEASCPIEKRTYTVTEIQDILEIGRNAAYDIVRKGYFSSVRIGGIIRISKRSFDAWLDGKPENSQVYEEA